MKSTSHRLLRKWGSCLALLLALAAPSTYAADSNPPQKMAFQGFLTDSSGNARGLASPVNIEITFRLFKSSTASSAEALWAEKQTVTVDKGHFSVVLGEGVLVAGNANFAAHFTGNDTDSGRYLGIQVTGESEISPRIQFFTAPYAFHSRFATELIDPSGGSVLKTSVDKVGINIVGAPASELEVGGTATTTGLRVNGPTRLNGSVEITGNNYLEFGKGLSKQASAGTLGYNLYGNAGNLDIVGAGTAVANRTVKIWAEGGSVFTGPVSATTLTGDGTGISGVPKLASANVFTSSQRIDGAVGVGGGPAYAKFRVVGSDGDSKSVQIDNREIKFRGDGDTHWSLFANRTASTFELANTSAGAGNGVSGTSLFSVSSSGHTYVKGSLDVAGALNFGTFTLQAYSDGGGWADTFQSRGDLAHSIRAASRVRAIAYDVASDARIKTVIGNSDGSADLRLLSQIQVTDYRFKDTVEKGSQPQKKVIAQQVEKVFPQAISKVTDVVPDIFRKATCKDGWVELATDLKKGDFVRLIDETGNGSFEVLEVAEGRFRTEPKPMGSELFVYGRQVSDFRVVDYDAIAMLNVSATQELARRLERREAEVAELREELTRVQSEKKTLAGNVTELDARLARLEKVLRQQASVNPNRPALDSGAKDGEVIAVSSAR